MIKMNSFFLIFLFLFINLESMISDAVIDEYFIKPECLTVLQSQINAEMTASIVYMNMAAYFNNPNVARFGFAKFFQHNSDEEREHAQKIIDYINQRGGGVELLNVVLPKKINITNVNSALEYALNYENKINRELHDVYHKANVECDDAHLADFIQTKYLDEQINSIHELRSLITTLGKMNTPMGEYFMDKDMLERFKNKLF